MHEYFENLYEEIVEFSDIKGEKDKYRNQFEALKSNAYEGYGHRGQLEDIFNRHFK